MTNKFPSTLPREWAILPAALRSLVSDIERHIAHSADAPALAAFPGAGLGNPDEAPYELDGSVAIVPVQGTLAFRIPGWTENASVTADGKAMDMREGYCYISGLWQDGD